MNIAKALQIIESHPKGPLALSVTVTDDGMIDASISPAGDTMETLASHFGPGTIEGAIIEMAAAIIPMFHVSLLKSWQWPNDGPGGEAIPGKMTPA
jgi:hypothetical protein